MIKSHEAVEGGIFSHREKTKWAVANFRARFDIEAVIGISGGADERNVEQTTVIILDFLSNLRDRRVAIVSGGTSGGIPELATVIAKQLNLPTVGVFPRDGRKSALLDQLDLAIESLPPSLGKAGFGTETPTFIDILHGMIIIGGEFGTLVEVATALKINKDRLRKELPIIYLCPIQGTGGIADIVRVLPVIKIRDNYLPKDCLPEEDVYTGIDAARFLRRKLFEN